MKFIENIRWQYLTLFTLAIVLYANTFHHGFVLDDEAVIVRNTFVQQGISGIPAIFSNDSYAGYERVAGREHLLTGGRYRPLSLAIFAIVFSIFGANSTPFHILAILFYALCGMVMYRLLLLILKDVYQGVLIAFITTAIFLVHPIHTEVVANIKSCDEQLALILGIGALYGIFKSCDSGKIMWSILSGVLLLFACLAKENAIMFVIAAPMAIWFFRKSTFGEAFISALPLIAAAIFFIILRGMILGWGMTGELMRDPLNNPFLQWNGQAWVQCSSFVKAATIIYTIGQYIRLMIFPFPLTHDYYPLQIALQSFSNPLVYVSLFGIIFLLVFGIKSIKKHDPAGFGILFFFLTLSITSNIFFTVGTSMAERFLFLPSLGFCLAIAIWIIRVTEKRNVQYALPFFGMIALVFSIMTIRRNPAWKDNETLFRTDVNYSTKSMKLRNDLGTILLTKALNTTDQAERKSLLEQSLIQLKTAIELNHTYYDAYLAYGACTYYLNQYKESVEAYRTASQLFPDDAQSKTGLVYALQAYGSFLGGKTDVESGIAVLEEAYAIKQDATIAMNIANFYHGLGQLKKVVEWYEKAVALSPKDAQLQFKLAEAYKEYGDKTKAAEVYHKAKELDPTLPPLAPKSPKGDF
jgi:tetratricopeptide (TPR) repeat protein